MDVAKVGGNEAPTADELTAAADVLHCVLAEVDAGRLPADLDHAAYLRGAVDTLQTTGVREL
ncbi:MAG: hypothetical protein LC808_05575 [Actinobacteria bacterium]|nr:hypothetical protein [Actinomycetota bacterium]